MKKLGWVPILIIGFAVSLFIGLNNGQIAFPIQKLEIKRLDSGFDADYGGSSDWGSSSSDYYSSGSSSGSYYSSGSSSSDYYNSSRDSSKSKNSYC